MKTPIPGCSGSRRQFLLDTGMGFTGLALNAMMFRDGVAQAAGVSKGGLLHHFPGKDALLATGSRPCSA